MPAQASLFSDQAQTTGYVWMSKSNVLYVSPTAFTSCFYGVLCRMTCNFMDRVRASKLISCLATAYPGASISAIRSQTRIYDQACTYIVVVCEPITCMLGFYFYYVLIIPVGGHN